MMAKSLFHSQNKEELNKLQSKLDSDDHMQRESAVKHVISLMRSGEDVKMLFSSMLSCVRTSDLSLKKLIYLYLVNYAETVPEEAIMAVNTFIQDSNDLNPLIRALAVKTMCRIRLQNVAEYMITPLKKALKDNDPYVRKTAAFGIVKLYEIIPDDVENANLFDDLKSLLQDDNPMVISNTIAALLEINEKRKPPIFVLESSTVNLILNALNDSSEWCQTVFLDTLSKYVPKGDESTYLIDRLIPFLKNTNVSVVVSAFKCIFLYMKYDKRKTNEIFLTIIPPLISVISSSDFEIQYVLLRTLSLFVQKYPNALRHQIKIFFCKYNEPSYVKMEKLDIIVSICVERNVALVLNELSEYCNSVDVLFVKKSIKCIGKIAIKIPDAAKKCVDILVSLISGKADYAIEESLCAVCDILRKYPGNFESVLSIVCGNLEQIKEPTAKSSAIWILGEYCNIIENSDVLLDPFLDSFHDEQSNVQLSLLSAFVKLFIHDSEKSKDQLQFVLSEATKPGNLPDVKNLALLYWKILSSDISIARYMLDFKKDIIYQINSSYEDSILDELIQNIGTVSGVLHLLPSEFVKPIQHVSRNEIMLNEDEIIHNWRSVRLNDDSLINLFIDFSPTNIYLRVVNKSRTDLQNFAFALNKNIFGIYISETPSCPSTLYVNDFFEVAIAIQNDSLHINKNEELQLAIKIDNKTIFGSTPIPIQLLITKEGNINQELFMNYFSSNKSQHSFSLKNKNIATEKELIKRNIFIVGKNGNKTYISFSFLSNNIFVGEIKQESENLVISIKGNSNYFGIIQANSQSLFT